MKYELRIMGKLKLSIFKISIYFFLASCFVILASSSASAQEISVSIDPPILQIDAKPPANINAKISVQNLSDQSSIYSIFLIPFKSSEQRNGQIEFDRSESSKYDDFLNRIRLTDQGKTVTNITLSPGERKDLNLHIAILKGEPPNDYYFSVLFISDEAEGGSKNSSAGTQGGIGVNVLLSIGPKTKTKGFVKEFSVPKFVTRGPVEFVVNIENTSSHYVAIEGNVLIMNSFGQKIGNVALLPVNILANSERFIGGDANINPGEPRVYWDEKFLLGLYTADLTVSLSEEGPIINKSVMFFALPLELILGFAVVIIIIAGIAKRIRSKRDEET